MPEGTESVVPPPQEAKGETNLKLQELLQMSSDLRRGRIRFNEGKGRGVTLIQGEEKKKREKPPEVTEPPVAPPTEVTPPTEEREIPVAPPELKPGEPPREFTVGLAAVKAGEGKEVIEEESSLAAKQKEQEEKEMYKYKWEKKDVLIAPIVYKVGRRGLERFWKNTIGQAAMFSKDKSQAVDMMAEAGLQYRSLPKEFRKEVDEAAAKELKEILNARKFGKALRFGHWFVRGLEKITWSTTDQELHRNDLLKRLRSAVIEIGEKPQDQYSVETKNIIDHQPGLLGSYKKVLTGDYNAREELIKRMADDVGGNLIDTVAGEKKATLNLTNPEDPLRKFLMGEVIKPLLREGLNGTGITEKTRLQMMVKLDEFMTSKEFVDWWSKAKVRNEAGIEVSLSEVMDASLSFGNTIISAVEQGLLPQLKVAWDHQEFVDRYEEYMDNLPLEIALGTVHRAQKEQMPLTKLEQIVSKHVDRKKVLEHYTALKDNGPSVVSHTGDLTGASCQRAELIRNLGARGKGRAFGSALAEAYWVAPIVAAVGISKTGAAALANGLAPVIGAAATYGVWRAGQEMSLFNSNVAMHRIERTLNYTFSDNVRLRKEAERFKLHQRGMVTYTDGMKNALRSLEDNQDVPANLKELLGYLGDIEARRQIQTEKKVTLFQASSWKDTSLQEKENTEMRETAVKTKKTLDEHFTNHPDTLTQLKTELGFSAADTLDQMIGVNGGLTQDFKNNILKGIPTTRLTHLGNEFVLDKKAAIQSAEASIVKSRMWKGLAIGIFSGTASGLGVIAFRPLVNFALDQAVAHNVPVIADVLKWADWVRKEVIPGPKVPHEILSRPVGPPVEKTLVVGEKTIKTLVPDGVDWDPQWRPEAGKTDVWDLIAVKKDGTEVSLINDATFDAATGKMTGFDAVGSKIPKSAIETFQNEFGLTSGGRSPDIDWVKKLMDLRDMSPGKTLQYNGYNFSLDAQNHLMVSDINGHEVAHNMIDFNPATYEITYKALPVNPIPEKLVAALQSAGFIVKKEEVYQNIHLLDTQGAETNLERIPEKVLKQIYEENKGRVHEFSDNLHWLAHGGWAKPAGELVTFDSNEAINIPFEKWQAFPMTEVVDGKRVFSLAHFLNWWEKAEIINENQVRILTGPEAGEIFDINPEPGRLPISQEWLKEAAQSHQTVLFDRLNKMASHAPKGFLDDLTAFKEGHGDPSRFALEARFDPLDTKGVVAQFSGNSVYNAYADPAQLPGVFKDNVFMNDRGDFRAWIHFIWTQKPGDYSEVYSLANSGPTEWVKIPLGNPIIDTSTPIIPQLPFNDSISEFIPTFQEVLKADIPGVIPWIPVRRPLEAPERVQAPRPISQPSPTPVKPPPPTAPKPAAPLPPEERARLEKEVDGLRQRITDLKPDAEEYKKLPTPSDSQRQIINQYEKLNRQLAELEVRLKPAAEESERQVQVPETETPKEQYEAYKKELADFISNQTLDRINLQLNSIGLPELTSTQLEELKRDKKKREEKVREIILQEAELNMRMEVSQKIINEVVEELPPIEREIVELNGKIISLSFEKMGQERKIKESKDEKEKSEAEEKINQLLQEMKRLENERDRRLKEANYQDFDQFWQKISQERERIYNQQYKAQIEAQLEKLRQQIAAWEAEAAVKPLTQQQNLIYPLGHKPAAETQVDFTEIDPKKPVVDQIGEELKKNKLFRGIANDAVLRSLITDYISGSTGVGIKSFSGVTCLFKEDGFLYKAQLNVPLGKATVELSITVDEGGKLKFKSVDVKGEGTAAGKAKEKQANLTASDYDLTEALIAGLNKQLKKYKVTIADASFEIKDGKLGIEFRSAKM